MSTKIKLGLTLAFVGLIIVLSFFSAKLTIGAIIIILSFLGLIYNEWLFRQMGSIGWAERHIRSEGGTRLLLKLICIFALMMGLLTITGLQDRFIRWIFGRIIQYNNFSPENVSS